MLNPELRKKRKSITVVKAVLFGTPEDVENGYGTAVLRKDFHTVGLS